MIPCASRRLPKPWGALPCEVETTAGVGPPGFFPPGSPVPNLNCPTCGLAVYSAAKHSTVDHCPRCGTRLGPTAHDRSSPRRPEQAVVQTVIGDRELECVIRSAGRDRRIIVHGTLAYPNADRLGAAAEPLDLRTGDNLLVDLRGVTTLDSSGLAQLLGIYLRSRREQFALVVVRPPKPLRRILELTGVSEHLTLVDHPDDVPIAERPADLDAEPG